MTQIVSIPREFIQPQTIPTVRPKLIAEIQNWCFVEMQKDWVVSFQNFGSRKTPEHPFEIFFFDDKDAIFFKLRWL